MPYDSQGIAQVSGNRPVNGQDTDAAQINVPLADIQSMLSQVLLKSGVAPMTGNLNMNSFRIKNLQEASADDEPVTKGQFDETIADSLSGLTQVLSTKSGNYTALDADYNKIFRFTGTATLSLNNPTTGTALRENWICEVWADGGAVTIDPDDANLVNTVTINGLSTLVLQRGQKCILIRESSTSFRASVFSDAFTAPTIPGYIYNLSVSANAGSPNSNIDVSTGAASSENGELIQSTSVITKNITSSFVAGSGNGGLDVGSIQATAIYYVWLIQRSDTGAVDALVSVSSTSPTMPTNYDRKRRIGVFYRRSSINSAFSYETMEKTIGVDQVWGDYSVPRSVGVTYQNATGRPIMVSIRTTADLGTVEVSENTDTWIALDRATAGGLLHCQFIVPNGHFYRLNGGAIGSWAELR